MRACPSLASIALAIGVSACFAEGPMLSDDDGSETTGGPSCPEGSVTCPCYGNMTCDAGLTCQPDVVLCIPVDCTPGSLNCTCAPGDGCTAVGSECIGGLCQIPDATDGSGDGAEATSAGTTAASDTVGDDATATAGSSDDDTAGTASNPCDAYELLSGECARFVYLLPPVWAPSTSRTAADLACTENKGTLPGDYRAFLALGNESATYHTEIAADDGYVYIKPVSEIVIADNGGDFFSSGPGLDTAIDTFAGGSVAAGVCADLYVATGVDGANCDDWGQTTGTAVAGDPLSTDALGFQAGCPLAPCDANPRLYCVQMPGT